MPRFPDPRYTCSHQGCDYATNSWYNFQSHRRNAHGQVPSSAIPPDDQTGAGVEIECFVCGQMRDGLQQLLTHFKTMHKFEDAEEPANGTVERLMRGVDHYLGKHLYDLDFERWLKEHGRDE